MVLYGHTPVPAPEWVNNTLCLDTGCVFGGRLTALRYPERELGLRPGRAGLLRAGQAVPGGTPAARHRARRPARARRCSTSTDVTGTRVIETGYLRRVGVREENAAAALEVMSRFAIDPRWLLYLPPTMSPVATSPRAGLLEHPEQAFDAYRADGRRAGGVRGEAHGLARRRAGVPVDADAARARFGAPGGATGAVWTRTGRPFFAAELHRGAAWTGSAAAAEAAGLFDELGTAWLLLDAELLPWSAKAEQLLRDQYAAVGAAARRRAARRRSPRWSRRGRGRARRRRPARTGPGPGRPTPTAFTDAYRRYCWPTDGLTACGSPRSRCSPPRARRYHERPHAWHLGARRPAGRRRPRAVRADPARCTSDTTDPASVGRGRQWWEELTARRRRGHGRQARREPDPRAARAWSSRA